MEPKVIKLKNDLKNIYEKKHEDSFNKMIAMTAYGILEAGGRNCLITLTSLPFLITLYETFLILQSLLDLL